MTVRRTFLRDIVLAATLSVFTILTGMNDNSFADSPYVYRNPLDLPITSAKCNEFTFDATGSKVPASPYISYFWDFGDGNTSIEPIVTHRYKQSGDYTVRLLVKDDSGYQCSSATTSRIVRANIPPHSAFESEKRACVNKEITFDASPSRTDAGKTLSYAWNFGDGDVRFGNPRVNKTYRRGGEYRVLLTVDDQSQTPCSGQTVEKIIQINEPPKAIISENVILQCVDDHNDRTVHFDASATTDVNDDDLTYFWDFGDGHEGTGANVAHQYEQTGNYDAKLIVSDNTNLGCGTSVDFVTVRINQAPKARAGSDMATCIGKEIAFNGSQSYIRKKGTAVAKWFFGDGTSRDGLYATHRYNHPGIYQATLSLENKLNAACPKSRDTKTVTVNTPPSVHIRSKLLSCVGKEILFDASSATDNDGDDLLYFWNFGDGSRFQGGSKARHTYEQGGQYRVSVVVDDQKGTSCSTATASINVDINTPPIADAGPNAACCAKKEAAFSADASSDPDGDRLSYFWDFGDGSSQQGENVTHTYSRAGSYNVRLTVDDHSGTLCNQSTDGFVAVVKEVPIPKINIR